MMEPAPRRDPAAEPESSPRSASSRVADELLDDLLPAELEWRRMVRSYPLPALAVAALGGYLLGRSRGPAILAALSTFVVAEMVAGLSEVTGQEVVE